MRPGNAEIDQGGREAAYAARYARWRAAGRRDGLFRRMALAIPGEDRTVLLKQLDLAGGVFQDANWPSEWEVLRQRFTAHVREPGPRFFTRDLPGLIEFPRFGRRDEGRSSPGEREWLLLELNLDYVRHALLPELIDRYLPAGTAAYRVKVVSRTDPPVTVYSSEAAGSQPYRAAADASATLFDAYPHPLEVPAAAAGDSGRGRWLIEVRHGADSLESVVSRARWRNMVISAVILALLLATAVVLVRFTRRSQKLAELQMDFVAGVSHELRTPLTVISTAAYNLRGKVAGNARHVERYGALIQEEAEKLTALLEQVLQFASVGAGRIVRRREPLSVEGLIEEGLQSTKAVLQRHGCVVETRLEPGLPRILGDRAALRHAIQNLLSNAAKYGTEGSEWIGVSASPAGSAEGRFVEIRVADRGPGIPRQEQRSVFEAFFRGRRALQDQIHGTGLGLNLVKRIVEAHGGMVAVHSEPGKGTEFLIRLPAAPEEYEDEFAHSPDRG